MSSDAGSKKGLALVKKRFPAASECACSCMDQQLDAALEQLDTDE